MTSFLEQPRAVWAVAFACVIAFMGIGLVDPILKEIAADLGASGSEVSLRLFGTLPTLTAVLALFALDLATTAVLAEHEPAIVAGIIAAGALLGINNSLVTEAVMGAAAIERPVASAAYSFVRFTGGAVGPYVAMKLFEHRGAHAPFWFGAVAIAVGDLA